MCLSAGDMSYQPRAQEVIIIITNSLPLCLTEPFIQTIEIRHFTGNIASVLTHVTREGGNHALL